MRFMRSLKQRGYGQLQRIVTTAPLASMILLLGGTADCVCAGLRA